MSRLSSDVSAGCSTDVCIDLAPKRALSWKPLWTHALRAGRRTSDVGRRTIILFCLITCAICAEKNDGVAIGDALLRPLIPAEEAKARQAVDAFEARLAGLRSLPLDQRRAKESRLGGELEDLLKLAKDTKIENKVLYLLAHWRMTYQSGREVEVLVDRILANPYPGFQTPAKALKVQVLLDQGRLPEARAICTEVVAAVPEMAGLERWCRFYELVGTKAPRTAGSPLGGAPADPATRAEPWLLFHFTGSLDQGQRETLSQLLADTADPAFTGVLRIVVVAESANPLALLANLQQVPGHERVDLLWSNPASEGDARAWREDWQIPQLPVQVLLGADRSIASVQPTAEQLAILIGKAPRSGGSSGGGGGRSSGKAPWQR